MSVEPDELGRPLQTSVPLEFDDPTVMSGGAREAVRQIKRTLHLLVGATVVIFLLAIGVAVYAAAGQKTTHDALCNLRDERVREVEASRKFLKENPNGIPGISRVQILQGIEIQQTTVQALEPLQC